MKKIVVLLIVFFLLSLCSSSSYAGSKQRHRWQGVAIGLGTAIIGHSMIKNMHNSQKSHTIIIDNRSPYYSQGHWEIREVWIEPTYNKVYSPAYYNRYDQYVSGGYILIETSPGYWKQERVWIGHR